MPDHRIRDLVQPVHAVEREPRAHGLGILLVDLRPVDVENYRQDENERPVEVFGTADPDGIHQILRGLRAVAPENKHERASLSFNSE